ncbi:hypothetical protein M406DRAFT_328308 [Cryphonectria parasitica EP155]|uniref:Uncharacterized protein n=1 Tax=Cryphonectria parasitica (strain ATCC 38755 / EP155) TaxID=660469 RepID=A0A9P4Y6E5_CRYP1|nr:uncharacterized protein M406DRAFT_328308 [Cryphonectria parasitica EP155]KAF3767217.1 hypothetical protein M406DRAFT_328308 [Cryphonectria parasitica EP155]
MWRGLQADACRDLTLLHSEWTDVGRDWGAGAEQDAMSTTSERAPFIEPQFLEDLDNGSASVEAPYSEDKVKEIIDAYGECFHDSAVQIRCGNVPGAALLFRVLFAIPTDTLDIALKHGWVLPNDPLVEMHKNLSQSCPRMIDQPEFTVDKGFDGTWQFLGKSYTLDEILQIPAMPDGIKANKQQLLDLGLTEVPITHLDYKEKTMGFYFLAQGPLTKEKLTKTVAMAGAPEPSDAVYDDIVGVLLEEPYYCTVVMDYATGKVLRIEYHLLFPVKLPDDMKIPDVGERLTTFWDIPSYEYEDMDILSFCFGHCPNGDLLALRSYCGGLRNLMKAWGIVGV